MDIISKLLSIFKTTQVPVKDVTELISAGSIDRVKSMFSTQRELAESALRDYNVDFHEIMSRPDKVVASSQENPDGTESPQIDKIIDTWKLGMPYQKKIVEAAVAFLFGRPVTLTNSDTKSKRAFGLLKDTWKDMRMDAKNRQCARILFSETECAKLFVPYRNGDPNDPNIKNSLKCVIVANSLGDTLYTNFDSFGGLTAFARGYNVKNGNQNEDHLDIYFADSIYECKRVNGQWESEKKNNLLKKIPVTYYRQPRSEWHEVQKLIDRLEWLTSTRADSNDYTADPILVLEGDVKSMPGKREVGKVVELETGAKASYLAPQMVVDMVKDERDSLREFIHYFTNTPDISLESMRNAIGGTTSGKAIELMFMDAILKSMNKQEIFGEMLDREVNIIRSAIGEVLQVGLKAEAESMDVSVTFHNPLPDQYEDIIALLSSATGGKAVMSQKTAVKQNPMVPDVEEEYKQLQEEEVGSDPLDLDTT